MSSQQQGVTSLHREKWMCAHELPPRQLHAHAMYVLVPRSAAAVIVLSSTHVRRAVALSRTVLRPPIEFHPSIYFSYCFFLPTL